MHDHLPNPVLFERCHAKNKKRSLKQHLKYFGVNFSLTALYRDHAERSSESALRAEFDDLNVLEHSRVLKIEDLSEAKRVCRVSSTLLVPPDQTMLRIFLRINFPPGYPSTATPTFVYGKGIFLEGTHPRVF